MNNQEYFQEQLQAEEFNIKNNTSSKKSSKRALDGTKYFNQNERRDNK